MKIAIVMGIYDATRFAFLPWARGLFLRKSMPFNRIRSGCRFWRLLCIAVGDGHNGAVWLSFTPGDSLSTSDHRLCVE